MAEITSLTIPHAIIEEAKRLGINCSELSREALKAEIEKRKQIPSTEG